MGARAQGLTSGEPPERGVAASPRLLRRTGRLVKRRLPPHLARGDSAVTDPPRQTKLADGALVFRFRQTILAVILGLVPRIQPSTDAGASGWMDGRDEPDHDNPGTKRTSHNTSKAAPGPPASTGRPRRRDALARTYPRSPGPRLRWPRRCPRRGVWIQ